jgi:hypothetical protein
VQVIIYEEISDGSGLSSAHRQESRFLNDRKSRTAILRAALKKRIRTETRVELHEVRVMADPQTTPVLCEVCADQQSAMIGPREAALLPPA